MSTINLLYPVPKLELTFQRIAKNGGSTVESMLRNQHGAIPFNHKKYLKHGFDFPIVAMWREPFERFESLVRYMMHLGNSSFEAMWRNPHSATQCESCLEVGQMPDYIIRWDWRELMDMLQIKGQNRQIRRNASPRKAVVPWDDSLRARVAARYNDDIVVWNNRREVA